jgi:putative protease
MEKQIGKVTHYFTNLDVAVLELSEEMKLGDEIHILGRITDFTQFVTSMEIAHKKIEVVGPGMEVAIKVEDYVRQGDEVFKVFE